jgi:hypothetical protein
MIPALIYWNHFRINGHNTNRLYNNIGYNKKNVSITVVASVDNAVNVNNWYAKYQRLQSTMLKESEIVQTNIQNNDLISLNDSCQQLNNSLLVAKRTPMIPNQAAQESWRKAQIYYQSAIGLCSFPKILTLQPSLALFINNLRQGDKQLLSSINYILNCC